MATPFCPYFHHCGGCTRRRAGQAVQAVRQAITAAGSGCMAAMEAEKWLGEQE